jgi:predicted nucleic acid-binding protein
LNNNERQRGILDTCVLIDIEKIEPSALPDEAIITAVSLAELTAGPHAAQDPAERALRQDRLQGVETNFEVLPFDASAARAYGRIYALEMAGGRKARGARTIDLLIASIAVAENLPLYTRNPADFANLASILNVIAV